MKDEVERNFTRDHSVMCILVNLVGLVERRNRILIIISFITAGSAADHVTSDGVCFSLKSTGLSHAGMSSDAKTGRPN